MSMTNEAAWIDGVGHQLRVGAADVGRPGPGEALVKTHAIAIISSDWGRQDFGIFVQQWPAIFSSDLASEIVEIGESVTNISNGQHVLAHALGLRTGKLENASFQKYTIVPASSTWPHSHQHDIRELRP